MVLKMYNSARQIIRQCFVKRSMCSSSNEKYARPKSATISLSEPLPDLPKAIYIQRSDNVGSKTRVTTLDNGLRVASEPQFGQFCTVGVCIDSGARYEVGYPSGVSHFLEKIAFSSTSKFDYKDDILQKLEMYGGICDCQSTRDTFLYAASVENRGLEATIEILGDVVLRPRITEEELELTRQTIRFELEDIHLRPDQEPLMVEAIHAAAFRGNTIGLPKICPEDNVDVINKQTLMTYLRNYHSPSRMVVAGVGVDHDQLVELAQKYFADEKPTWSSGSGNINVDQSVAQYTGGLVKIDKDLSNASLGPTPMPELAHLSIGLESSSHQHDDFIPTCVLQMLMGGGGSFSAGGPGKGMYTRLYTNVLNRYHWMYSATAFNHAYADSGVFCINSSAHPTQLRALVQVIVHELAILASGGIESVEFNRAKSQLKSMLMMNLESRPVIFEDLARQVLAQGHREEPEKYIQKINQVTPQDIQRVAEKMLRSKPSVAAIGTLDELPDFHDIELGLLDKNGKMPKRQRFSLFR